MKRFFLYTAFITTLFLSVTAFGKDGYYYQLKVYYLKTQAQEERMDNYLKDAYLPALHRAGIKQAGVFKPIAKDTTQRLIYVFVPVKKFDEILSLDEKLKSDKQYLEAGKDYLNAAYNNSPYTRFESIILKAFAAMPEPAMPKLTSGKSQRVYELRSYESATEALGANKTGMFNDAEIAIFAKLNFNAVFYGQVISGSRMPNLMYLTTFNNKADRDKHWADFTPEYRPLSTMEKYKNNVSKSVTVFLYPTEYSDI